MANKEAFPFVMGFVESSDKHRSQFIEKWREVVANFIVDGSQTSPYGERSPYHHGRVYRDPRGRVMLKDAETHKLIMTLASKLMRSIFGDSNYGYVRAEPVGWEDSLGKAETVTRLLRYAFAIHGHFRTFLEATIDMLLFGTSVIEVGWKYEERDMLVREVDTALGIEASTFTRLKVPVYDDVVLRPIDIHDFYPDPGQYRIHDMSGCAKHFKMTAAEAKRLADGGVYDKEAVEKAINRGTGDAKGKETSFRAGLDQPQQEEHITAFKTMDGYEYVGDVPWDTVRKTVTILNTFAVRERDYQFADYCLPYHTMIINPVQGRFYGISPAEVIRHDQSFADAVKILLAEAIIRQVHPPIAYDPNSEIDPEQLLRWKADTLIPARGGPSSVGTVKYDANIQAGFQLLMGLKTGIQEGSGAPGGIQGQEGPDREAASVGMARMQMAMDRPELAAMVLESECLPPIALAILRRYQQFTVDTEDLARRIGEQPAPFWLGDIMAQYDVRFLGSRMAASKQQKLQAFDRMMQYASISPAFQAILPNMDIARTVIGEYLEMPDVALKVGDPAQMQQNMAAQMLMGKNGGGPAMNGVPPSAEPAGMLPAQAGGGLQ